MKKNVTITQMAKHCHVTSETIRRWIDSGEIPSGRTLGGHRRIEYSEFIRFLERNNFPSQRGVIDSDNIRTFVIASKRKECKCIVDDLKKLSIPMEIEYAYNPIKAGHRLAEFHPQLIIICTGIPGLNLSSTCKFLRRETTTRNATLIAINNKQKPLRSLLPEFDCVLNCPEDLHKIQNFI